MAYNPLHHHRRSVRLFGYDYAQEGAYFITLCCHEKKCLFGKIQNGEMHLNQAGQMVQEIWQQTPHIRPYIELGEFIIMPNHFHAIVTRRGESHSPLLPQTPPLNQQSPPTQPPETTTPIFRSPSRTIGAVVRGFKGAVSKQLRANNLAEAPVWQRNYYEHIIRDHEDYQRIAEYILSNPERWQTDVFYQP